MDQLPRLGKREIICLLSFTCNFVVFVRRGFLFLWVLGMGYVILLWHSLSLPYNYFAYNANAKTEAVNVRLMSATKIVGKTHTNFQASRHRPCMYILVCLRLGWNSAPKTCFLWGSIMTFFAYIRKRRRRSAVTAQLA